MKQLFNVLLNSIFKLFSALRFNGKNLKHTQSSVSANYHDTPAFTGFSRMVILQAEHKAYVLIKE